MADQQVITTMGTSLQISLLQEATIHAFKARLRGALLRPGETGYDDARTVWNGMIDRPPRSLSAARGADVIDAVQFARTHSLLVSVRGGSHNVPGNAVCDGGLMIDLSGMKSMRVDLSDKPSVRKAGSHGASSITRPRRLVWRPPAAPTPRRASRASRWAGAWAGWPGNTGWRVIICSPSISSPPRAGT